MAFPSQGDILRSDTGWLLFSAGMAPRNEPSAAYTNEFWPISTCASEVMSQLSRNAATLVNAAAATAAAPPRTRATQSTTSALRRVRRLFSRSLRRLRTALWPFPFRAPAPFR